MSAVLYNEWEPYAAQWIRNLMFAGHISKGTVDARDVKQITWRDLEGITRAHFFAGIAVWEHAMREAGWPADLNVWSASLPCQPFSVAGAREGLDDERHLWPDFFRLVCECRPSIIVGEQVSSTGGAAWFDAVCVSLEEAGYAVAAIDTCAASIGAPHKRQRLYWCAYRISDLTRIAAAFARSTVADDDKARLGELGAPRLHADGSRGHDVARRGTHGDSTTGALVHADREQPRGNARDATRPKTEDSSEGAECRRVDLESLDSGATRREALENADGDGRRQAILLEREISRTDEGPRALDRPVDSGAVGFWDACEWVNCTDGFRRPVEPGTFPLAYGAPARVGRLRAYGNAIVGPLATTFLRCVRDSLINAAPTAEGP